MSGFPGETEACFQSLLEFIRTAKFERLGVFTYSPQDGTRAGKMEGQIPARVKKRRQKLAMAEQLKVAREIAASCVGREMTVLVEAEARPGDLPAAEGQFLGARPDPSPPPPAELKARPRRARRFLSRAQPGRRAGH